MKNSSGADEYEFNVTDVKNLSFIAGAVDFFFLSLNNVLYKYTINIVQYGITRRVKCGRISNICLCTSSL